ncbi:MAG: CoA transferase [Actinomycetota bacterium]
MGGPLEGISVLDLSQVVAGPLAAQILAEQGAEVIKVEPIGGELTRIYGVDHIIGLYANCNRGKRCLAVDTSVPTGVEIVLDLMATADVVIQNFRPGVVERLGIDYAAARNRNPDVIYASVSGFGTTGPYSQRPVLDPVIQGLVGMVDGQISNDLPFPDLVRTLVADKATANTVAQSVTAALFARERGAGGQHIELSMLDATLSWFWPDGMADLTHKHTDIVTTRPGDLYRIIDTLDGQVVYFIANRTQFEGMWRALGRDDFLADDDFCDPARFRRNPEKAAAAAAAIVSGLGAMTTEQAVDAMAANHVPGGPVLTREEVFDDPQVQHLESIVTWDHPVAGTLVQAGPPGTFSATQPAFRPQIGSVGEHTDEILRDLGRDDTTITDLRNAGVVA